jgi:hypothetical protein
MILSLLALVGATISVENPGIRLELFLKDISIQTGVGFHCSPYLNNEVLAASFKDQPIDIVKSQLARVIHGTWVQKEDGWWLIQTPEQKKEEEKWVWETRNKMLQFQIDGLKAVAPKSEWTINEAEKYWINLNASRKNAGEAAWTATRRRALRLQSPESRLCAAISSKLTVDMFTEDPLKFNINRYSIHGLPGHIELPIDVSALLAQYRNENDMIQSLSEGTVEPSKPVHIELKYSSAEREFILFTLFDKDWKSITNLVPGLYLNNKVHVAQGEVFTLSKETQEIIEFEKELDLADEPKVTFEKYKESPLFNEQVSVFSNASKRDPLGIIQGRCWIDFAIGVKKPLLVSLRDDEGVPVPNPNVPTISQSGFVLGMKREDADGWVLGRPINPMYCRSWRADRRLIEEYSHLAKLGGNSSMYSLLRKWFILSKLNFFSTGIPHSSFIVDDQKYSGHFAAVLGTLSEQQVDQCLKGERIPVTSLPIEGQDLMTIFAKEGDLNDLSPLASEGSWELNPLYYLPNGIKGMTMGASIVVEPEFRFEGQPPDDEASVQSIRSFARLMKESDPKSPILDAKFTVGSRKSFVTSVYLGAKSKSVNTDLSAEEKNLPVYTWKTLPDSIRQQVLNSIGDAPRVRS